MNLKHNRSREEHKEFLAQERNSQQWAQVWEIQKIKLFFYTLYQLKTAQV